MVRHLCITTSARQLSNNRQAALTINHFLLTLAIQDGTLEFSFWAFDFLSFVPSVAKNNRA